MCERGSAGWGRTQEETLVRTRWEGLRHLKAHPLDEVGSNY